MMNDIMPAMMTKLEEFGLAYSAARQRADELLRQGYKHVEYFPCYPDDGEPHWRVAYRREPT